MAFCVALMLTWLAGCYSTVRAPQGVDEPVTVYLVSAALHSGVVLPESEDRWVEFGFGEYQWYALGNDAWYRSIPCVLWPTRGTLGQRRFSATTAEAVRRQAYAHDVYALQVEKERAETLRATLQSHFDNGEPEWSDRYRMSFIPADDYWFLNNCHDSTADWFEQLGCDGSWVPIRFGISAVED